MFAMISIRYQGVFKYSQLVDGQWLQRSQAWHVKQEQRTRVKFPNSSSSNVRRKDARNSGQIAVATPTYNPKHTMWPSLIAGLALLASQAQALYFYIDGPSQKCFFEELPKDTLVVGMQQRTT